MTLTKEVRRSFTSQRGQADAHESRDGEHRPQQEGVTVIDPDSKHLPVAQLSSTASITTDAKYSEKLPRTPLSNDLVDDEPAISQSPRSESQDSEKVILDLATSSFPPVPKEVELPRLAKPVLIPRVNPGSSVPFARAWAPELAKLAITKEEFVTFVDNMNIMISPHVAFHVLKIAAFAVGLVPYDVAEGIGGAIEAIAILGAAAMNYKRTKGYLSLMNEKYFHPRGLHVKIISTKRMKKLFELEKKDPCLAPLTEETLELSTQDRCLKYLSQYICELSFDVPAPSPATTMLAKISTWEIKHKIRKADRCAKLNRKRTWKRHQKGKKLQERWEGWGERQRIKSLGWLLLQNLDEWEAQKAEKEAKRREKGRPLVRRNT